jgi:hypothetical protein
VFLVWRLWKERGKEKERTWSARHQWLTPVILATQGAEIKRTEVWGHLGQIVQETLSGKNPSQKRADGVAQGVGSKFKNQHWKKKKTISKEQMTLLRATYYHSYFYKYRNWGLEVKYLLQNYTKENPTQHRYLKNIVQLNVCFPFGQPRHMLDTQTFGGTYFAKYFQYP